MHPGLKSKHNQARAIVEDMTLAEKARFCSGKNFWHLEASERHDLPEIMVTDGPHGLRKQSTAADHAGLNASVPATCFPTACALASSWDEALLRQVGDAIGRECVAEQVTVLLGPGVNIKRHPYCGRNFEYFSEDPLLTGKLAAAFIDGVQANGVGTSIKHFAVNNQEQGRMIIDAVVDERTLREIYLRGFELAITGAQPWTVMCAYNRVNGVYCSEHDELLNQILRDEWEFEGLVVTDWGAANDRPTGVAHGLDLEMPASGGINDERVLRAVQEGTLDEAALDQAIARNVSLILLGADLAERDEPVDLSANHALARRAAAECAVLLKNDAAFLPLEPGTKVAIIGEFAKQPRYQGTGSSQVNPTQIDSAWDALNEILDCHFAQGFDARRSDLDDEALAAAVALAEGCDAVIVFAGLPPIYESEGFDRARLDLPEQQNRVIDAVCDVNANVAVVLANGSPVTMPWVEKPKAILEGYLGGQAGGSGIADVLTGIVNPSGRLAETFALRVDDIPSNPWFPGSTRQVQYREGLFVGYRYFASVTQPVLFPFGHGLSYTRFDYDDLRVSNDGISVTVANVGDRDGAEVVQVYVSPPEASERPKLELRGFSKVRLTTGEAQRVTIPLDDNAFRVWDPEAHEWRVQPGEYTIAVGASSTDLRLQSPIDVPAENAEPTMHPKIENPSSVSDPEFAALLGRAIPDPESSTPFHWNSAVKELDASWIGRRMQKKIVANFTASMGVDDMKDETLARMWEEMAGNMPLRALALFSRGKLSFEDLDSMIALLNGQYLKWLFSKMRSSRR